ncbi:MAG TPA: MFS transporter [Candidatus Elarobacter sp.]|jgi:hypothetical protein
MNPRTLAALASLAILMAGTTAPTAMFVAYRSSWGLSTGEVGLVFAVYVATLLPVLLLFGGIADRIGRRAAIGAGLGLALCGLAAFSHATALPALIAARLLQGAGVGIASGAIVAATTETYRGKLAPGTLTAVASSCGIFAGPLVVAAAYDLGAGLEAAYWPLIALTIVALPLLRLLPSASRAGAAAEHETPLPASVVSRALGYALPVTFVGWVGVSLYLSMVPAFLAAALHARDPLVGALVISAVQLAGIASLLAVRRIVPERDGIAAPLTVVIGLVTLVAGTALHGGLGWALVALSTLLVGGGGALSFASGIVVATAVCRGQRARVFARLYVAAYLAFALPALAVGAIAARSSLLFGFATVIAAVALVVAALPVLRARAAATTAAG